MYDGLPSSRTSASPRREATGTPPNPIWESDRSPPSRECARRSKTDDGVRTAGLPHPPRDPYGSGPAGGSRHHASSRRGHVLEDGARGGGRRAGRVAHSRGRSTGGAAHRRAELLLQGGNRADYPLGGLLPWRGRQRSRQPTGARRPAARRRGPPANHRFAPRPSPATRGAGTSTAAWSPGSCRR